MVEGYNLVEITVIQTLQHFIKPGFKFGKVAGEADRIQFAGSYLGYHTEAVPVKILAFTLITCRAWAASKWLSIVN